MNKKLLGIVLTFVTAGLVATGMDSNAYDEVYAQHDRQETAVQKLLKSEFVSATDQKELQQAVKAVNQAEKSANRRTLQKKITAEQNLLKQVKTNAQKAEQKAASKEWQQLAKSLGTIEKKGTNPFTEQADIVSLDQLQSQLQTLQSSTKVAPIRKIAKKAEQLASTMADNQQQMKMLADDLTQTNETIQSLLKKKYLLAADKSALTSEAQANQESLKKTNDLQLLRDRKTQSLEMTASVSKRISASETDFKDHQGAANKLLAAVSKLLSDEQLEKAEKTELVEKEQQLSGFLQLKSYQPGDLKIGHQQLQEEYDTILKAVNKRKAAAAKAAEEKAAAEKAAAEKAAKEAAAAEQKAREQAAAQEAVAQQAEAAAESSSTPTPSVSGGWYQAPAGFKYLKVESGKTYGQVKNPDNFVLITAAEAANYTPGHGNGSAKQ